MNPTEPDLSTEPDVLVVIVTRNTCALTAAAVRSVLESRDRLAKEIVVVDNDSTDDTPVVLPRDFPAVKYLRCETNLGFARANNLAVRQGSGAEFVLLLNSDARLQPESLAAAVAWMRGHPDCAVAGAQLLHPDGSRQNSIANFPSLATELLSKSLLRRLVPRRFPGKERQFTGPIEVESVIGAFMLIRRDAWRDIGGLDERYFFFLEETDFCLQVRRRGWKVFHLPEVRVWHEQGATAHELPAAARVEYWRSRYRYFEKNSKATTRVILRAGLCLRLLVDWLANLLMTALTLGCSGHSRRRFRTYTALGLWHLRGCPADMGLPRGGASGRSPRPIA